MRLADDPREQPQFLREQGAELRWHVLDEGGAQHRGDLAWAQLRPSQQARLRGENRFERRRTDLALDRLRQTAAVIVVEDGPAVRSIGVLQPFLIPGELRE